MTLEMAMAMVKQAGYRVTKPKAKRDPLSYAASCERRGLNAVGKPYSPLFDPKYKLKTSLTSIARLRGPQVGFPWKKDK